MPTPPENLAPITDRFRHLIDKPEYKAQTVADLSKHAPYHDRKSLRRCRARGKCEWPGGCTFKATDTWNPLDPHHKQFKSQGGATDDENLACICRTHHNAVHSDPTARAVLELAMLKRGVEIPEKNWLIKAKSKGILVQVIVTTRGEGNAILQAREAIAHSALGDENTESVNIESVEETKEAARGVEGAI